MHLTHLSAVQARCRDLAVQPRCRDRKRTAKILDDDAAKTSVIVRRFGSHR